MTAASLDRDRLAKLLGMMGSAHDGEVVAAARQAERMRAEAGLTWQQIMVPTLPPPPKRQNTGTVGEAVEFLLDRQDLLTEWERDFVGDIGRAKYRLSDKQLTILDRLLEKARRAEARAA